MSYIDLGRKKLAAAADTSGLNEGNWTNAFTHDVLGANVSRFECYKVTAVNLPGSLPVVTVFKGTDVFSTGVLFGNAEWDPNQPMPLSPDDDVYICWNQPATGTAPTVWVWLRYDPSIQSA